MLYEMMQNTVLFCLTNSFIAIPVLSRFTADEAVGGVYRKITVIIYLTVTHIFDIKNFLHPPKIVFQKYFTFGFEGKYINMARNNENNRNA